MEPELCSNLVIKIYQKRVNYHLDKKHIEIRLYRNKKEYNGTNAIAIIYVQVTREFICAIMYQYYNKNVINCYVTYNCISVFHVFSIMKINLMFYYINASFANYHKVSEFTMFTIIPIGSSLSKIQTNRNNLLPKWLFMTIKK